MTTSTPTTGKRDGDDDDDTKKSGNGQQAMQGTDTGVESGEYKHPDYIPGETEAVDNSQL